MFGVPIGAVGAMSIQRTLTYGIRSGIVTGMGSSVADVLYASVVAFGLTFVSDLLMKNQSVINIAGGSLILLMGIRAILKKPTVVEEMPKTSDNIKMFFQSLVIGITNPTAILSFVFACTYFEISGQMSVRNGFGLVIGVFVGTMIWWIALALVTNGLRNKLGEKKLKNTNKVFGVILILVSIVILLRTITN